MSPQCTHTPVLLSRQRGDLAEGDDEDLEPEESVEARGDVLDGVVSHLQGLQSCELIDLACSEEDIRKKVSEEPTELRVGQVHRLAFRSTSPLI